MSWIQRRRDLREVGAFVVMILCHLSAQVNAQNYLTSTGVPAFSTPDPVELGFADTANGNLHLVIKLGSYAQRGDSKPEEVNLVYDSNIWQVHSNSLSSWWLPDNAGNNGGWRLSDQIFAGPTTGGGTSGCRQDETWRDRNGTVHVFPMPSWASNCTYPASAYATDSSGFLMVMPSYGTTLVYAPDGTLMYRNPPINDASGHAILVEDANGNYLSGGGPAGYPTSFYDTLGRTFAQTNVGGPALATAVTTSQGSSLFQPTWTSINLSTQFQLSGVSECNNVSACSAQVMRSLSLPDGSTYYFTYDCDSSTGNAACSSPHSQTYFYGELTSVTLPTGGVVRYAYTMFKDSYGSNTRWLNSKVGSESVTYTPSVITTCTSTSVGCQQQITVQRTWGSTIYTFTLNNGAWPTTVVTKDAAGRTLSTITNTWDFSQPCVLIGCHGASWIRLLTQTTTMNVPAGASITKQTTYAYDNFQKGNVTAIKEWKFYPGASPTFPSVPDRATYTSYYSAGYIINKPQKITLCSNSGTDPDCPGGGSKIRQTIVTYDSYGGNLTLVSGTANHDDANFGTSVTARGNPTQVQEWTGGTNFLTVTRQYDTTGQMLKSVDPMGNPTLYSYADAGAFYTDNGSNPPQPFTPSQTTNAYLTKITLPPVASGTMVVSRGYYYGSGKTAVETDQNGVKSYHHFADSLDRPTQNTWPATTGAQLAATGGNSITYPSQTEADVYVPVGDTAPATACTSCRQTQFLYDGFGRKITQALANAPGGSIKVDTAYDTAGRVLTVSHPYVNTSDPSHVFETFGYDGLSRQSAITHPDGQSVRSGYGIDVTALGGNASQGSTSYGYGYPAISEDETLKQRQLWTDGFGNVIEVDEPSVNNGTAATTTIAINTGPGGQSQTFDPCQPHSSCPQTAWNSGSISITVNGFTATTSYGLIGPPPQYSTPQTVATALAAALNDPASPVIATSSGGQISLSAKGPGTSGNFSYSSSTTFYSSSCPPYNPCFGGPALSPAPASGSLTGGSGGVSSSPFSTYYGYDAAGHLTQVSQGVQSRSFGYDGLGRPTSMTTPEGNTDTLKYDSDTSCPSPNTFSGHLVSKTDARGIRTCFQYDALGRVTAKNYSNGQGSVTYGYDQGGSAAFALGRLTSVADPSGSENYTYDTQGAGRIMSLQKIVGTTTYTIGYQYNTAGQITQTTYPSARSVQQSFDNVGRLSSIVDSKGGVNTTRASGYSYNNSQQVTGFTYGNGVNAAFSFSPQRDELSTLSYAKGTQTLFSVTYLYQNDPNCASGSNGNNGQINCINDGVDSGRSLALTYDSIGRAITALTSGSVAYPRWGLSWTYDRYGNRLQQAVTAGSGFSNTLSFGNPGGAQTNRPDGLCFDNSGNLTAETGACPPTSPMYSYDADNRMTSYAGSSAASYVYDAGGIRVKKCAPNCTSPTSRTVYIFSEGKDIAEYDNGALAGSPSREYIYSGGTLLTTLSGSSTVYHHSDHLSVRLSTDTTGSKIGEQGHYPYGESWYQATTTTKFIYTSYERDSESQNDYALGRYYHVRFGRFCSPDPIMGDPGDPQSWNRYVYVRDNPVNDIDPSGFSWLSSLFAGLVRFFTGDVSISSTTPPTFPSANPGSLWDKLADEIPSLLPDPLGVQNLVNPIMDLTGAPGKSPCAGAKLNYSLPDKNYGTVRRHIELQHMLTLGHANDPGAEWYDGTKPNSQYRSDRPGTVDENWAGVERINQITLDQGTWEQDPNTKNFVFEHTLTPADLYMASARPNEPSFAIGDARRLIQMKVKLPLVPQRFWTLVPTATNRLVLNQNCQPVTSFPTE